MSETKVFVCNRGQAKTIKVQLEINYKAFARFKERANARGYHAKDLMAMVLNNYEFDEIKSK